MDTICDRRMSFSASILAVFIIAVTCNLSAGETLWSIGSTDKSSKEFAIHGAHRKFSKSFGSELKYVIGNNEPSSWPAIQPGPIDAWAGSKAHPLHISFTLGSVPAGQCELVVDSIAEQPTPGVLQITINGAPANLSVAGGCGDAVLDDDTKGCPKTRKLAFHPSLLKAGDNEITLAITSGSWLIYDAIRLDATDNLPKSLVGAPETLPSACLVKHDGKLAQVVRVKAFNAGRTVQASASTNAGSGEIVTPISLEFGENIIELPVTRVEKPTTVTVALKVSDTILTGSGILTPQREWTIYATPSIHTDIGYTDTQENVMKRHNDNLDKVLDMCAANPLFKWNIEVAWELRNYFDRRPPEAHKRLIDMMKQGRIGLQAGYLNMLTALMSDESMNRYIQYAGEMHRKHGIDISSAILTDVPTATWSVPSTLAASGVKYFAEGSNQTRGPVLKHGGLRGPFYWEGPDGAKVLSFICNSYAQSRWLAHVEKISDMQEPVLQAVRTNTNDQYPYDAIYQYGAFGDNDAIGQGYGKLVKEWNAKWASPQIVIATGPEFFQYIEKKFGDKIPVKRGDFGAFWEDGAGSTMQETIQHMANQHRATAGETLWAMGRLAGAAPEYPAERFAKIWSEIILYAEHTWGAAQSISDPDGEMTKKQWAVKAEYAHQPDKETRALLQEGLRLYSKATAGESEIIVVNPNSWERSGLVEVPAFVPAGSSIVDAASAAAPIQGLTTNRLFYAANVPAFGSKRYHVDSKPVAKPRGVSDELNLENEHYKIQMQQGVGITSIIDKETKRELVDAASPWKFGQVVYAAGGEHTSLIEDFISTVPAVIINDGKQDGLKPDTGKLLLTGARIVSITAGERGDLFDETILKSEAPAMPTIETHVKLHRSEKRISVDVQITSKTEIRAKEAVYVAFPVASKAPKFRLGMTNAVARPEKDFLHGGCHEWYCVQDFVACSDGAEGPEVIWSSPDAPLVTLGQVNSGRWQTDFAATNSTIFSYALNNYWFTNYKAGQGGDFRLRYDITSHAKPATNVQCVQFARESAQPLLCIAGKVTEKTPAPPAVKIEGQGVIATSLATAADGKGVLVRLRNCELAPVTASIVAPNFLASAVNLVELPEDKTAVTANPYKITFKPQQTRTVLLSKK